MKAPEHIADEINAAVAHLEACGGEEAARLILAFRAKPLPAEPEPVEAIRNYRGKWTDGPGGALRAEARLKKFQAIHDEHNARRDARIRGTRNE